MKEFIKRLQEPTPRFFQKIRNLGLLLTAVGGAIATAPVALPVMLTTIAGYVMVAGAIASAISQTAVEDNRLL